ncbi:hypothetical protein AVEN_118743-1 [Araneus ventricosus]|uniref:Uncharacterized protein n=1 Tax=Araneus ventricosus TaxID=182803 RepID=A0A4Y2BXA3_ARAVE|nr:hypothetical protein AVEN_118743-1 [Araneus ventricosus]
MSRHRLLENPYQRGNSFDHDAFSVHQSTNLWIFNRMESEIIDPLVPMSILSHPTKGSGGLVIRSWFRERKVAGLKANSTKDPPCMWA